MTIITIERHIIESQKQHPDATGSLSKVLSDIALATKIIAKKVNKAGLVNILGKTGEKNVQGEEVTKLDEYADEVLFETLASGGTLCLMASEENDNVIHIPEKFGYGDYIVCFDPLDGSGNIDANVSVGTIFSVYKRKSATGGPGDIKDLLRKGSEQVAAGYVIFGSSNMFVYSVGQGAHGFTLDPSIGEYVLSHPDIKTPTKGKIYSINEGNYQHFSEGVKQYVKHVQTIDKDKGLPLSARYIGSFVADFHRNLLYGGIYIYPGTAKNPQGKLRYLYEAAPLAFICEQAGGLATNGEKRILDIEADDIHMRTPLVIGSKEDVELCDKYIQEKV